MGVKMKATLPKGDGDGFAMYESSMISDPKKYRVALIIFDSVKTETDNDSGEITAVLRIRRGEVVLEDDIPLAESMIRRALGKRTGGETLDYDTEEDLKLAFPGDGFGDGPH